MIYARFKRWELEQERWDFRSAQITAAIYNVNRGRNRRAFKASDFMPQKAVAPKQMTVQQSIDYVAVLNRLLGGQDLRKKPVE